ncbi:hypothetical protein JYU34_016513 [Plutella xylostella]|uniref:Gustatory receptor n=1 Tax=Plutella xylostella TaxID=51655 RepID=A0ABQ7Q2U7_PLUXY|nr:hypothetical protein JYU34_016513 [Plutella xylostella]
MNKINKSGGNIKRKKLEVISKPTRTVLKLYGVGVFEVQFDKSGKLVRGVSSLGIFCIIFWIGTFYFSAIYACVKDHTILRAYYETKLKHYGDAYERITSMMFFKTTLFKVAWHINGNVSFIQAILDIDKALESHGVKADYKHKKTFILTLAQLIPVFLRGLTICATLWAIDAVIPYDRVYQLVLTDSVALMVTTFYCHYLNLLTDRYKQINEILTSVKEEAMAKVHIDAGIPIISENGYLKL